MPRKQRVAGVGTSFSKNMLSRREFVKLGGAGLAGAALLGACGGGGEGSADLVFAY